MQYMYKMYIYACNYTSNAQKKILKHCGQYSKLKQPETFQSSKREIGTRDKPTAVCCGESTITDYFEDFCVGSRI